MARPPDPRLVLRRRRRTGVVLGVVLAVVLVVGVVWFSNSPAALPTSDVEVVASTPVEQPIYVGVLAASTDFDRTLQLSGVKVHTTSNTEVSVTPLLCRGGSVGVTTDPESFCTELVNPEGQELGPSDDIVLQVTSDEAAIAVIDRVRLGFREGLQWGTLDAGSPAIVRVLGR